MKIYLVGGAVRDKILGIPVKDRDYLVVGSTPQEMIELGYKPIGKNFPVFLHPKTNEEYALARTEKKIGKGYHGFEFYTSPNVTLEEDLMRRDITINAIAEDEDGNIYDPYNGLIDIENKVIRHVSDAFIEDPLRVFRVARFFARFEDFIIHKDTEELMKKIVGSGEISSLSSERIKTEILKGLNEKHADKMFLSFSSSGVLKSIFPDFVENQCDIFLLLNELKNTSKPISVESKLLMIFALPFFYDVEKSDRVNYLEYFKLSNNAKTVFKGIEYEARNLENFLSFSVEDKLDSLYRLDFFRRPNITLDILEMIMLLITTVFKPTPSSQPLMNIEWQENKKMVHNKIELVKNTIVKFTQEYTKLKSKIDPLKTPNEIKELIYKERLSILRKVSS
jgi:tRNA nucleotidyltransferase (CCA-adding enzyme)